MHFNKNDEIASTTDHKGALYMSASLMLTEDAIKISADVMLKEQ